MAVGVRILRVNGSGQRVDDLLRKPLHPLLALQKSPRLALDFVLQRFLQALQLQHAAYPLHRHLHNERLRNEIHRPGDEHLRLGVLAVVRRHENDGQAFAALRFMDSPQHLQAVHPRHMQVQQYEVRLLPLDFRQRLRAGGSGPHIVADAEKLLDRQQVHRLVVHGEDALLGARRKSLPHHAQKIFRQGGLPDEIEGAETDRLYHVRPLG